MEKSKKKIIFSIIAIVILLFAFSISAFANNDNYDYTKVRLPGYYNGITMSNNTWGESYGIFGGIMATGFNTQYVSKLWSTRPDIKYRSVTYGIMFNLQADITVNVVIPYKYTGNNYIANFTCEVCKENGLEPHYLSDTINGNVEGTIEVKISDTYIYPVGADTYFTNDINYSTYQYTYTGTRNPAFMISVKGTNDGTAMIYIRIWASEPLSGGYSDLITPIEDIFDNSNAQQILSNYIAPVIQISWITIFVSISFLSLLACLFINWVTSL